MRKSHSENGIMQKCHHPLNTQEVAGGSHFIVSWSDVKSLSDIRWKSVHLLPGCLLTSLFDAHPSWLWDKCHLPHSSPGTLSHSWQMSGIHEYSVHRQTPSLPSQLWSSFQRENSFCQRLCVTRSAFPGLTSLFECSNRTVTPSLWGWQLKVRRSLFNRAAWQKNLIW